METQSEILAAALPHRIPTAAYPASTISTLGAWQWVPVRKLHERHRPRVLEHLLSLNEADRHLRFGHVASDSQIGHYVAQLDFERDDIFGIFDSQLHLVATAHLALDAHAGLAEFGVSVQAHLRGRGIGARLFERAVTQARNRGARNMAIHIARENAAMLAIVRRAGAHIVFDGAEATAQLDLPARTLATQVEALVESQVADIDYRIKMQVLRLDRLWPRLLRSEFAADAVIDGVHDPVQMPEQASVQTPVQAPGHAPVKAPTQAPMQD